MMKMLYNAHDNRNTDLASAKRHLFEWRASNNTNLSSGISGQRRPRSACAFAQSDQGLHCPLTESVATTKCINGKQRPG